MAAVLKATLPPLLKAYLPDYEPATRPSPGKAITKSVIDSKPVTHSEDDTVTEKALSLQASKEGKHHQKGQGSDTVSRSKKTVKSPSRERTMDALKRKQKQFGHKFDDWQQVKQEARDEEQRRLHAKIILQRELIHAQDALLLEKQREREAEAIKRLREERAEKQRIHSQLHDICQQSLDEDRQRLEDRRTTRRERRKTQDSTRSGLQSGSGIFRLSSNNIAMAQRQVSYEGDKYAGTTSIPSPRSSIASMHAALVMSPHGSTLQEEDESEAEGEGEVERPWYVEQLYHLFGREADDFLHPKMKQESKMSTLMDLPLAKHRECDLGAGALWTLLREDSYLKLLHEDSTISNELKSAYSSFIRQCLVHRKKPVERNFCAEADVPELQQLMDETRIREAQNFTHKVELMYRASRSNKDRSLILLHNNPVTQLPTGGDTCGNEGIAQYLPSFSNDNSVASDTGTVHVYKKWLKSDRAISAQRGGSGTHKVAAPREAMTERLSDDWTFLVPQKEDGKKETKTHCIKFLKERDNHFKGEFSAQMKARFDKDDVAMVKLPPKPGLAAVGSADSRSWSGQLVSRAIGSQTARETTPSRDALHKPRRTRSEMTHTYNDTTLWEPLTLSALMEYKKMREVFGTGDFARGRVPLWPVKTS